MGSAMSSHRAEWDGNGQTSTTCPCTPGSPAAPAANEIVGASSAIRKLRALIARVGPRESTVLIQGETGTGKELVARHLHQAGRYPHGPFIPVDCATLHDTLMESQFFGHVRGAFTGADRQHQGFIRAADGGTLFLDEIGDLNLAMQAKLLRVLQEREVVPLGGVHATPANVRVLAATNHDLEQLVRQGRFREDLLFRLNVLIIRTTPLRERCDDVAPLVEHFLRCFAVRYHEPVRRCTPEALALLECHSWPGNVRELGNVIERMLVGTRDNPLDAEHVPPSLLRGAGPPAVEKASARAREGAGLYSGPPAPAHPPSDGAPRLNGAPHASDASRPNGTRPPSTGIYAGKLPAIAAAKAPMRLNGAASAGLIPPVTTPLDRVQGQMVLAALREAKGRQGRAARLLGVERHRLYRLIRRYNLHAFAHRHRDLASNGNGNGHGDDRAIASPTALTKQKTRPNGRTSPHAIYAASIKTVSKV